MRRTEAGPPIGRDTQRVGDGCKTVSGVVQPPEPAVQVDEGRAV
ncbi:MAG: hypothetical protein ACRDQA_10705 [Nocardioidaceae bacterium]